MSEADTPNTAGPARTSWAGVLGDVAAAAIVLLGGGLLGGTLFQVPDFLGPTGVQLLGPAAGGPSAGDPPQGPQPQPESHLATLILLALPAALMLVRRRWPIPVFALAFAAFVVAVLLGLPSLGPGIATTIAAYAFAFRVPRLPALAAVSAAVVIVMVLSLAVTGWESLDARVFQIGAAFAIAAALGDSARSRQEYLLQAEDRARRAEQTREAEAQRRVSEDRLRIARDLHDTVAHQISVINLQAGAASGYVASQPDRALSALSAIREASRGVLGEIGGLLRYLREDESIRSTGPAASLQGIEALGPLLERMREAGLAVETDVRGDLARVTGITGATAFRVVQEGLTNAHKHGAGGGTRLRIDVGVKLLEIEVENPVPDVSPRAGTSGARTGAGTGLGLVGLRERVAVLEGTVSATLEGGNHRLHVELPLQQREGRP